jgi:hypothetical protein
MPGIPILKTSNQSFKPRRPKRAKSFLIDAEQPLFKLTKTDSFNLSNAYEGVQIFGGTGSGKTSGSGRALAHSFLKSGFGGLVLCAKPSERQQWEAYAKECNRIASVIVIDGKNSYCFNFLDYELARIDDGASIDNVVSVFTNIMEASKRGQKASSNENPFWKDASREYLSNAIELLYLAYGKVRLLALFELSQSLPKTAEDMQDSAFQERSFFFQTIAKLQDSPANPVNAEDLRVISNYFSQTFATLDNKTKSNLMITLSSMISPFMKGKMRELFATHTTIVPEMSHEGAIIIVDLPLKIWEQAGIVGQHIFKYAWQRATERREITSKTRPVFLWADESQFFVSQYDKEFQSTARSSKACSVYLTQSINGYFTALGDEHAAYEFLTNFQTKIFHANTDPKTNQYAAEIIGKYSQYRGNYSNSSGSSTSTGTSFTESRGDSSNYGSSSSTTLATGGSNSASFGRNRSNSRGESETMSSNQNQSQGASEVMDYLLQPSFFTSGLKKGGTSNQMKVDGVIMTGGQPYSNALPFMVVEFSQI